MAASPASDGTSTWSERYGKLDRADRARVVRAIVLLASVAFMALAVPVALLVRFHEQHLPQVFVMGSTLCCYVFLFLICIWRSWSFYTDMGRLSYGLLLAHYVEGHIGPRAAVFVLHMATAWAAAYLGCCLALHRLRSGAERAIVDGALPIPCPHSKERANAIARTIPVLAALVTALWTAVMAAIFHAEEGPTDELSIVFMLSYVGWIHVAVWVLLIVVDGPMTGALMREQVISLLACLLPCLMASPAISIVSIVLSVLFQWLMMMAMVAFLAYSLTVYVRYLQLHAECHGDMDSSTLILHPGDRSVE